MLIINRSSIEWSSHSLFSVRERHPKVCKTKMWFILRKCILVVFFVCFTRAGILLRFDCYFLKRQNIPKRNYWQWSIWNVNYLIHKNVKFNRIYNEWMIFDMKYKLTTNVRLYKYFFIYKTIMITFSSNRIVVDAVDSLAYSVLVHWKNSAKSALVTHLLRKSRNFASTTTKVHVHSIRQQIFGHVFLAEKEITKPCWK